VKRYAFVIGTLVFAIAGATVISRLTESTPSDFTTPGSAGSVTTLETGNGWALEKLTRCDGIDGLDGFRVRVGNRATRCFGTESSLGSTAWGEYRGAGHHFAWFHFAAAVPPTARFYSSMAHGTDVTLHAMGGQVYLGVVDLGAADSYGVQFLAHDGTLLSTASFVTGTR
jgi:hypothetical protein